MNKMLIATAALLALAGCASQQTPATTANTGSTAASNMPPADVSSIDSTRDVVYTCDSPEGPKKVGAMYGVKDNTLVVAQIKIGDQLTPGLYRVLNDAQGERQNSYLAQASAVSSADLQQRPAWKIMLQNFLTIFEPIF